MRPGKPWARPAPTMHVAANGPKMLALASEIADGAMPAMRPVEFTAQARQVLGPDKLLVVGRSMIGDGTTDVARQHLQAGADHVTILPPLDSDFSIGVDELERLAPALASRRIGVDAGR